MTANQQQRASAGAQRTDAGEQTFWVVPLILSRPAGLLWAMNAVLVLCLGVSGFLVWMAGPDERWQTACLFGVLTVFLMGYGYWYSLKPIEFLLAGRLVRDTQVLMDERAECLDLTATVVRSSTPHPDPGVRIVQALLVRLPEGFSASEPLVKTVWLAFRAKRHTNGPVNPFLRRYWGISSPGAKPHLPRKYPYLPEFDWTSGDWLPVSQTPWPAAVDRVLYVSNEELMIVGLWFATLVWVFVDFAYGDGGIAHYFPPVIFMGLQIAAIVMPRLRFRAGTTIRVAYGVLDLLFNEKNHRIDAGVYIGPTLKLTAEQVAKGEFPVIQRNKFVWRVVDPLYDSTKRAESGDSTKQSGTVPPLDSNESVLLDPPATTTAEVSAKGVGAST